MALDLTAALDQYGFVGDLANSIPELKAIFAKAASEEWDPARFERAVMDSNWWKTHADQARALATQHITDPATYNQTLANAAQKLYMLQRELGLQPSSAARLKQLALSFLTQNLDDEQIKRQLSLLTPLAVGSTGALQGDAAQLEQHLRQVATNYGVPFTSAFLKTEVQRIQNSSSTVEGFEAIIRARAKAAFPQFADQLDAGLTVRDIADPYISTMANTLEAAETSIALDNPWIKKALSTRGADGVAGTLPLWQFERQLKDDPRWDKTKQARDQAFDTIAQVGRDFGFEASA
jgi:hypothetical protein